MYIRSVQTTSTPKGEQADRLTGEQSSRLTDFKPFSLQAFLPNPEPPKAQNGAALNEVKPRNGFSHRKTPQA